MAMVRSRIFCAAVAAVAVAALAAFPGRGQAAPQPAPSFALPLFDGKTLRLDDLRGSPVILLFWAPW
jgi:hypothetical protein